MDYLEPYICRDLQNIIFDYKAQLDHWEKVKFINHQISYYSPIFKSIDNNKTYTIYYEDGSHQFECKHPPPNIRKFRISWKNF